MIECKKCKKNSETACADCYSLIDGGLLRRKLDYSKNIILESPEGEKYPGELFMVSPVSLGIKCQVPSGKHYTINLQENLQVKVQKISDRGKFDYHGFDIIEVRRQGECSYRLNNDEYMTLTMSDEQLVEKITESLPDNVKGIVFERLTKELEKAKILDSLQVGQVFKYQKDTFKPLNKRAGPLSLPVQDLVKVAKKCCRTGEPMREVLLVGDKMYDAHAIPFDYDTGGLLVLDVTAVLEKEREIKKKEKRVYREVIEAVTCGKLLLAEREEIAAYMAVGTTVLSANFRKPEDLDSVRRKIERIFNKCGIDQKEITVLLICISEALTNAVKHADGGTCKVNILSNGFRIEVSDTGPGIAMENLPKATLMKNFSTKQSLGCGFTIMLKYADRLILSTGIEGTTLIIEKSCILPVEISLNDSMDKLT